MKKMTFDEKLASMNRCGWDVTNDFTQFGMRTVLFEKTIPTTIRDPFGNANGEGEQLITREITLFPDGHYEED